MKTSKTNYWETSPCQRIAPFGHPSWHLKSINKSIQNNNIDDGNFLSTLNQAALQEKYHFQVNGYANGWFIDVDHLKDQFPDSIQERPSGAIDVNLILEFNTQKKFYLASIVSSITIVGLLFYMIWHFVQNIWYARSRKEGL